VLSEGKIRKNAPNTGNSTRLFVMLLSIGVAGLCILAVWSRMLPTPHDQLVASYANRGVFSNLNEIFLIPAFMFFGVLVAYSITELYKSYRIMSDPETYRRHKFAPVRQQPKRNSKRIARRQNNRQARRAV